MGITRAGKYGRCLGTWIEYTILSIPEGMKENYRREFIDELCRYSFIPRRAGEPRNEGCVHELSDLAEVDIRDPRQLARLVKEGIHLMYQKQTSARVLDALTKYLLAKE